jgi:hypothetical protein
MSDPDETPNDTNPAPYQEDPPATQTDPTPARPENGQVKEDPKLVERGGRDGPEPTRYGDWENKGIAVDF